jgi:hypothetical protein
MVPKIDLVINELKKPSTEVTEFHLNELRARLKVLDEHRGINVKDYIPDIAGLFE